MPRTATGTAIRSSAPANSVRLASPYPAGQRVVLLRALPHWGAAGREGAVGAVEKPFCTPEGVVLMVRVRFDLPGASTIADVFPEDLAAA